MSPLWMVVSGCVIAGVALVKEIWARRRPPRPLAKPPTGPRYALPLEARTPARELLARVKLGVITIQEARVIYRRERGR